jgi:trk system potassium uptake protein TrkA
MRTFILIVGGGDVGYYLAKTLLQSDHSIGIVERSEARCRTLAENLNITVINGDGTDIGCLKDAGADEAKYVVAVTGKDEENLVICQLAKKHFRAPLTIARVKDPKSGPLFKVLGVDATVSTTALAAQMIENAMPLNGMRIFSLFQQGDVEIMEVEVREGSPIAGALVSQLSLPEECVLITVIQDGKISFPRGRTILRTGDRVFALAKRDSVKSLKEVLLGESK